MPAAFTPMPSVQVSDFEDIGLLIRHDRLVCDFYSSGQRFACGFLQIPPRDGHPCRPANSSPCRACRGLTPPSERALPGAPKKAALPFGNPAIPQSAAPVAFRPPVTRGVAFSRREHDLQWERGTRQVNPTYPSGHSLRLPLPPLLGPEWIQSPVQ